MFVEGPAGNVDADSVEEWLELIGELRPARVYVTTLGSGKPQDPGVWAASRATLGAIASRLRECTSLPVEVIA